ncbi:MAG: hypothetical protein ACE5E6_09370 [Phycisphaerae bacterium]
MEIFLDDVRLNDVPEQTGTLADTVRYLQSERCDPGGMIIALRCDGVDLTGDAMTESLGHPATEFERLDVYTGTQAGLVRDAMRQAATALEHTEDAVRRIAQGLARGDIVDSTADLADCVKVWQQINDAVAQSLAMLHVDPSDVLVDDRPLSEALDTYKELLVQIKDALRARDNVMLADVLEYEFGPVAQRWQSLLEAVGARADADAPP